MKHQDIFEIATLKQRITEIKPGDGVVKLCPAMLFVSRISGEAIEIAADTGEDQIRLGGKLIRAALDELAQQLDVPAYQLAIGYNRFPALVWMNLTPTAEEV